MTPVVVAVLSGLLIFFTGLSNFVVSPFRLFPVDPANGAGLDPLLQNLVMTIHPPAMYIGLIGLAVPAAYVLAALWTRVPSGVWIPVIRRWTLFAWLFLSAAIVLGGMWAYMELGWGGYWEWDPVENASLMPWLVATAFLHSLQIEERRGMLRMWTMSLGIGAFLMTLIGTYITRSGVLKNSVHSFTGTGVGPYFVVLFWVAVAASLLVFYFRRDQLQDKIALDNIFSKEGIYLLLNMLFTAIAGVVLFGTFYPIISKAFLGNTAVLTVHFFNSLTAPLFMALILLLGTAPVIGWRNARVKQVVRGLWIPWVLALALGVFAFIHGFRSLLAFAAIVVTAFGALSMVQEYIRAVRARVKANGTVGWVKAMGGTLWRNRRRYGGYLAHIAFVMIAAGIVGSHTNAVSVIRTLKPGESVSVRGYHLVYQGMTLRERAGYELTQADIQVSRNHWHGRARPGLEFFPGTAQPVATVSIKPGFMQDLYMVLDGSPGNNKAVLQVFINPMVSWIWIGMYILVAGTLVAMSASSYRDAAPVRGWEIGMPTEKESRVSPGMAIEGRDRV
jgi:cytochrome c-type biogenesis protein CcmF